MARAFRSAHSPSAPAQSWLRPNSIDIKIEGLGGHAARPNKCIDSVLVGSQLITALQSIVSRTIDPLDFAVISICEFHAGNARNVIPQTAELRGTVRTLTPEVRETVEKRVREICEGVAKMTGAKVDLVYERGYPVTKNHADQTDFATQVAKDVAGAQNVHECPPLMGAEDFAICWKRGRAPSSSAATATAQGSITPPTISTTRRSCTAPRTGSSWSRTSWRRRKAHRKFTPDRI